MFLVVRTASTHPAQDCAVGHGEVFGRRVRLGKSQPVFPFDRTKSQGAIAPGPGEDRANCTFFFLLSEGLEKMVNRHVDAFRTRPANEAQNRFSRTTSKLGIRT